MYIVPINPLYTGGGKKQVCYLSYAGVTHTDDVEEGGHDLRQELHTLEPQRLEDEGDGLHHHGVVVGERGVPQDAH